MTCAALADGIVPESIAVPAIVEEPMHMKMRLGLSGLFGALVLMSSLALSQTHGEPEEFNAIAMANNELGVGAGRVLIRITRWSTEAESARLVNTLREKGSDALLDELSDARSVGTIRTPDTLAYDLRYAHQTPTEEGGRRIVIATDRPIGFWESVNRPRTLQYPFTVIQMQMGADGEGHGTMSYATKIRAYGNIIDLEDFATAPVMLTEITSSRNDD
jgi:hypothetical protein